MKHKYSHKRLIIIIRNWIRLHMWARSWWLWKMDPDGVSLNTDQYELMKLDQSPDPCNKYPGPYSFFPSIIYKFAFVQWPFLPIFGLWIKKTTENVKCFTYPFGQPVKRLFVHIVGKCFKPNLFHLDSPRFNKFSSIHFAKRRILCWNINNWPFIPGNRCYIFSFV